METIARKIGNSTGTILPSSLLKKLNIKVGDSLEIKEEGERIVITPSRRKPKYTLKELLAKCDEMAPMPQALVDWDESPEVGNEKW